MGKKKRGCLLVLHVMLMMLITACTSKKVLHVHCARPMRPSSLFFLTNMYIHICIYNESSDRRFSLSLSHVNLDLPTQSLNKMNVYMCTVYNITFRPTSLDTLSSPLC